MESGCFVKEDGMKRKNFSMKFVRQGIAWVSAILIAGSVSFSVFAEEGTTVTYENLSQLLIEGNLSLQQANDSYETNKKNYQELLDTLREEQEYMKFLAKQYEGTEEEASYSANASILGSQASRISRQIESMNRKTQTLSLEKNIDAYTMTAQTLMNSYNQMIRNVEAKEKSVQAAEAAYQATSKKQSVGAATMTDVLKASDQLSQQKNLLASYQQRAGQLRFQLLSMLGIEDGETVTVGAIPQPDMEAIEAIDFESDKHKAINNNDSVKNVRRSYAGSTAEITRKAVEEMESTGNAENDIQAAYQKLQASKLEYQAALDAYESAWISYQSLQKKRQAGMLDQTDYLQGEADYLQALSDRETASMNLYQAYESYG